MLDGRLISDEDGVVILYAICVSFPTLTKGASLNYFAEDNVIVTLRGGGGQGTFFSFLSGLYSLRISHAIYATHQQPAYCPSDHLTVHAQLS